MLVAATPVTAPIPAHIAFLLEGADGDKPKGPPDDVPKPGPPDDVPKPGPPDDVPKPGPGSSDPH